MTSFSPAPSRRAAVFGLLAAALTAGLSGRGWVHLRRLRSPYAAETYRRARALLVAAHAGSYESAASIGRHYLRSMPEERNIDTLLALIDRTLADDGLATCDSDAGSTTRAIARSIRNDFADGRIVSVQGWMLSRTEARIGALAALARA